MPNNPVVFFDEGFVQKSFMFISPSVTTGIDETNLFGYLNNIPLPDLIVYINADLKTCYERMLTRSNGLTERLRQIDKDGILKFLETASSHIKNIASWLKQIETITLIEIGNDNDLEGVVCDLENRIKFLTNDRVMKL